ncbi:MAG: hypothetical protein JZU50_10380 [Desulfobulbaceae bacterium]|nr:hypothetical protein [Desulfobulbaceae bacterium]
MNISLRCVVAMLPLSPGENFTVLHLGRSVDPFAPNPQNCGVSEKTLWEPALAKTLTYRPTGLLIAGFSPVLPERERVDTGDYSAATLALDSSSIVFWVVPSRLSFSWVF